MNPIQKLRRLFKGNPRNDFLSELYSKTSKPLFVHPQLGTALIDSYLKIVTPTAEMNVDSDGVGSDGLQEIQRSVP